MTIDAYVLPDPEHAVIIVTGTVEPGCGAEVRRALVQSESHDRGHIIVDIRQLGTINPEVVDALMWELGRAFDEDRTLRLVVRDDHQAHFLNRHGARGMVPVHTSLAVAISAAERAAQTEGVRTQVVRSPPLRVYLGIDDVAA